MMIHRLWRAALVFVCPFMFGQQQIPYQTHFPPEEFAARRAKVYDKIGPDAFAMVQGAPAVLGFIKFRQSNEFYYFSGIETPGAYIVLDGHSRKTTLYLPHRDERRERGEGKTLSAEDEELVKNLTGVDDVAGVEMLSRYLGWTAMRVPRPALYTPLEPAEGAAETRDELQGGIAAAAADPWDGSPTREAHFVQLLQSRFPQFAIRDLSPILDSFRIVKSPLEVELVRRASIIAGLGILEAMRSTAPGVTEYQLDAAAHYIFLINGAQGEGYRSITAGGKNEWMGHYYRNSSVLKDGDILLMDYAPDYGYYTSDVARMWPVNGKYTKEQKELCEYVYAYRDAVLKYVRPGVTPDKVMEQASVDMEAYLGRHKLSRPEYEKAARAALKWNGHMSHPVGMAVHDVGSYHADPLRVGTVFSVDPSIWIPEDTLYVRIEDVVVVTEKGVENFTNFLPAAPDEIEKAIKEQGILEFRPASPMVNKGK